MSITSSLLKDLIKADDPIKPIWDHLLMIWNPEDFNNLESYYSECEEKTRRFEMILDEAFTRLYDVILPAKCESSMRDLKRPTVWMDGMSIREAQLLARNLDKLKIKGYSFSALPSNTISYRKRVKIKPEEIIQDHFNPMLEGREERIWCRIPGSYLDNVKGRDPPGYERLLKDMEVSLSAIADKLDTASITVTSDHGYIDVKRAQRGTPDVEKRLQNFFGSDRFFEGKDPQGERLVREGYAVRHENFYLIKGRRSWTRSGRYNRFLHGGVSLMECLLPIICMEV